MSGTPKPTGAARADRIQVEIYTKDWCPFCALAKALLTAKGQAFTEYEVGQDLGLELEMRRRSGRVTVPQVFIDGRPVGGFDELSDLERAGALDRLLGRGERIAA